jgi:hypothetical protein
VTTMLMLFTSITVVLSITEAARWTLFRRVGGVEDRGAPYTSGEAKKKTRLATPIHRTDRIRWALLSLGTID